MGRRARRRTVAADVEPVRSVWQTARVRVDDATWAEYRRSLGDRSVAEALGAHVEREVAQWSGRQASRAELDEAEVRELLERIEVAGRTLEALTARLERRLPLRRD